MLGDAANSYNPIIQAMIATANLKQKSQQQEEEKAKNKAEQAAQKEHLNQAKQILDNVHEHNVAQEDVARLQAEADHLRAKSATFLALQQARQQGSLDPVKAFEMIQPHLSQAMRANPALGKFKEQLGGQDLTAAQANPEMPGLGGEAQPQAAPPAQQMTPDEMFGNPETQMDLQARGKGKIAGAEAAARLPSEQELAKSQFGFQKQLQDAAHESSQKIAEMGKATQYDIAKMSKDTQLAIARMTNDTHLKIAGMGPGGLDSPATQAMVVGGLTGDVDLDGSNPIEKAAMGSILQAGAKPVGKKDLGVLQQAQRLSPLFSKLDEFADKLPETKLGAAANAAYQGAANKVVTTDLMNDFNKLKAQLINTGKTLEGMTGGRVSVLQMQTDLDSYASLKVTREQMRDRIQNLKDYYKNNVDELVYKGTSPAQRDLLYKRKGVLPAYILFAPQTHPGAPDAKLDIEQSLKEGEPTYRRKK